MCVPRRGTYANQQRFFLFGVCLWCLCPTAWDLCKSTASIFAYHAEEFLLKNLQIHFISRIFDI